MARSKTGNRTSHNIGTREKKTARTSFKLRWVDRIQKNLTILGIHNSEEIAIDRRK